MDNQLLKEENKIMKQELKDIKAKLENHMETCSKTKEKDPDLNVSF